MKTNRIETGLGSPWRALAAALLYMTLIGALATPVGCDNAPQRSFHAALESYNSALRSLIALYDTGRIGPEAADRIEPFRAAAWDALLRWEVALEVGAPPHAYIQAFNDALDRLILEMSRYGPHH